MAKMTIKWLVADKKLVKFNEEDDAYTIAEGVNLEGLKGTDSVDVEIVNNIVEKMAKGKEAVKKAEPKKEEKAEEKKESPKVEEPQNVASAEEVEPKIVTWTVSAFSKKASVLKFEEQSSEKYWYPIKEEIRSSFENVNKGDVVTVKIAKVEAVSQAGEKYMKDGIIGIKTDAIKKAEPAQKGTEEQKDGEEVIQKLVSTSVQQPAKRSGSYRDEDATDKRTASMNAKDVVVAMINSGKIQVEEIDDSIKKYIKLFYKATQELS